MNINQSSTYIKKQLSMTPEIGLVLGSGLGVLADDIENKVIIRYEDIPSFPKSTVEGHEGQLVFGQLRGKHVVAMQGRFHYYEGYSLKQVTFPICVLKELGIQSLIVTNAAGGMNDSFSPGDLMIINDHMNQMGSHPLMGENNDRLGPRFPDMTNAYDQSFIELAKRCAKQLNIDVKEGVYVGNTGPSYETPAEVRMFKLLGGDAVGMSTVPEVIVANYLGIKTLGISCISNMAAGLSEQPLSHEEVIETTNQVREAFIRLMKEVIETM
ncbi:MAG TPA: purine-nucleoside phosphorylase [Bacillota bacterium]|nr:purine-nucleoside phosphorylase [Bacillota bacterium]